MLSFGERTLLVMTGSDKHGNAVSPKEVLMKRVVNFNPGPATLPLAVLERARDEFIVYRDTGMSILETSHRSKTYEAINAEAEARIKRLLGLDAAYRVLFLQGGASLQFAMVPYNFLPSSGTADYILTGSWAEKAAEEAARLGNIHIAASTRDEQYRRIPTAEEIHLSERPAYVHITSNNTIYGTQWQEFPEVGDIPLVADMSSDILSRPFDATKFALIYAGAQKNLGPAGVTVVIIRQRWLEQANPALPVMLRYATHVEHHSLYNTPPVFAVYLMNLVLEHIEQTGGLEAMGRHNQAKAACIYQAIDESGGFYQPHASPESRSLMNITFRLPTEELTNQFISAAEQEGLVGLKGHRSVGGIRASIYNAMTLEGCQTLAAFMSHFASRHG